VICDKYRFTPDRYPIFHKYRHNNTLNTKYYNKCIILGIQGGKLYAYFQDIQRGFLHLLCKKL